jgi:hypothetical protein
VQDAAGHDRIRHLQVISTAAATASCLLEWLSSVISAQSNVREQLVESYDSFKGELSETAEESTRLAGQLGAEVAKSSSNAVSSKKPSNPVPPHSAPKDRLLATANSP